MDSMSKSVFSFCVGVREMVLIYVIGGRQESILDLRLLPVLGEAVALNWQMLLQSWNIDAV